MVRAMLALLLVPLVWPWIAWPAINTAFRLLAYGSIGWHWDFANAIFNWRNLFSLSYALMVFLFLPAILLFRVLRWTSFWIYPLAGGVIGFAGPLLLQLFTSADELQTTLRHPSTLLLIFQSNEVSHYQLGSGFASAITLSVFWVAAVWKNPWYSTKFIHHLEGKMGAAFWIRRFFTVLVLVSVIIALVQWAKGHELQYAITQGVIWGTLSAAVFTVARIYQSRRKQHCAICKDTPEMLQSPRSDA